MRAHQDAVCAHSQKLQPLSLSSVIEATRIWSLPLIFVRTGQTSWQTEEKYLIPQKNVFRWLTRYSVPACLPFFDSVNPAHPRHLD